MNMKLLTGLAVAITLASAMSFVGLATRHSSTEPTAEQPTHLTERSGSESVELPSPNDSVGPADVKTSVNIIDKNVKTTLDIKK